jgi:cytochrome c peroxidase
LAPGLDAPTCAQVRALIMAPTSGPPPAPGNAHADSRPAALLGYAMFFDQRFSHDGSQRCATCHAPEFGFSDGKPVPQGPGIGVVTRNSPDLRNAAWGPWQFWDGRAGTLWAQPLATFENPNEMNITRIELVHLVVGNYRSAYEALFGALPDPNRLPPAGKPGQAAFDALPAPVQHDVNVVAANLGKALEAYMRHVFAGASEFDAAAADLLSAGRTSRLSSTALRGIRVFAEAGCLACHNGPALSDGGFHNLGVPAAAGVSPDPGAAEGLPVAAASPFSLTGPYADAATGGGPYARIPDPPPAPESVLGAFKTPSLRNLTVSAPYGHNGVFATLEEVVDFHLQGGGQDNAGYLGTVDAKLVPHPLSQDDRAALLDFLRSLDGTYRGDPKQAPNWWRWPDR